MPKKQNKLQILEFIVEGNKLVGFALDGVRLSEAEVGTFAKEAHVIQSTLLWKLLSDRTIHWGRLQACDNAQDFGDVREARGALQAVKRFQEVLEMLSQMEKK